MAMMAIAGMEAVMATRALELGPIGQHVADSLGRLRRDRGLEQADLADLVTEAGRPMSASILSKIEAGRRRIDVDDLVAIAAALDVNPSLLLLTPTAEPEPMREPGGERPSPVGDAVREDIEALGDLVGLEPSLAELAHTLARQIDHGCGEFDPPLTALTKELRATLKELWAQRPAKDSDDDLDDLATPE
jgi:transcriptional regulator with XRE-family HTH domain